MAVSARSHPLAERLKSIRHPGLFSLRTTAGSDSDMRVNLLRGYCRSRWRGLSGSAAPPSLHMDCLLCLQTDSVKEHSKTAVLGPVSSAAITDAVFTQVSKYVDGLVRKDTLLLFLGELLYLADAARHLLGHHKQQVGVVDPLGVNQPADGDSSVRLNHRATASITSPACAVHTARVQTWSSCRSPAECCRSC